MHAQVCVCVICTGERVVIVAFHVVVLHVGVVVLHVVVVVLHVVVLCSKFMRTECLNSRFMFDIAMPISRLVSAVGDSILPHTSSLSYPCLSPLSFAPLQMSLHAHRELDLSIVVVVMVVVVVLTWSIRAASVHAVLRQTSFWSRSSCGWL